MWKNEAPQNNIQDISPNDMTLHQQFFMGNFGVYYEKFKNINIFLT